MNEKQHDYIMETLDKHDDRIRDVEINMGHFMGKIIGATVAIQAVMGVILTLVVKFWK